VQEAAAATVISLTLIRVHETTIPVPRASTHPDLTDWIQLLRWNKPSGRLILLIPAGWSLWLSPAGPPAVSLVVLIVLGGVAVSGAGCIANDLWDRRFDREVARTRQRPLAQGRIPLPAAFTGLGALLLLSLAVVLAIPGPNRLTCLILSLLSLPPILLYPSAKRWFAYPQSVLAICWGFAVLIPWAASGAPLIGSFTLVCCWLATLLWTFGFDTVYAMADQSDDARLGLRSSALSLGPKAVGTVRISYGLMALALALAAGSGGLSWPFWPCWLVGALGMQLASTKLTVGKPQPMSVYGLHFRDQVWLGALMLLGVIVGRIG